MITEDNCLITADGSLLPVRILLTEVNDKENETIGYVFSAQDLTLENEYKNFSITDKLTQIYNCLKLHIPHSVTASFGVSCFSGPEDNADRITTRADQALYKAKESGKNKVITR